MSLASEQLNEFITVAEKSRKYSSATAQARRYALKVYEIGFNDSEKDNISEIEKNIDAIHNSVYNKNKTKMTLESWRTYLSRMRSLLKDFNTYGSDPSKMAGWNRQAKSFTKKKKDELHGQIATEPTAQEETIPPASLDMARHEFVLRPGVKAIVIVPHEITKEEVQVLEKFISFLESIAK